MNINETTAIGFILGRLAIDFFSTVINYIIKLIIKTIWYKQPVRRRKRKRKDRDKNQKVYDDTQNYNFRLKSNIVSFSKIFLLYRVNESLF